MHGGDLVNGYECHGRLGAVSGGFQQNAGIIIALQSAGKPVAVGKENRNLRIKVLLKVRVEIH